MTDCAACRERNPDRARFCWSCGAPIDAPARPGVEERKTVSVVFCDIVGFTSRFDGADPEDVRALLRPYSTRLRAALERFGGTVEKFIGDAVMAVFGAPVAHEDDAERAVRAALGCLDVIGELNDAEVAGPPIVVRIGVDTGEVVAAVGGDAAGGEAIVTGDTVSTAARLQAAAPPGTVAVGEATWSITRDLIEYRELGAVTVKGKAAPQRMWRAVRPRSRVVLDAGRHLTPLVGRERQLQVLQAAFDRAVADRAPVAALISGDPGVGKSRLVAELFRHVDGRPELVSWRTGRCTPFREGGPFAPLADVVKAHTGILDAEAPAPAAEKLAHAVGAAVTDPADAAWLQRRMAHLLATRPDSEVGREELFTAWGRFFAEVAGRSPLVLVFEDVHWADDGLLAFVEHLLLEAGQVPLMVVMTSRPEHPERADGLLERAGVVLVDVPPLPDPEMAALLRNVLDQSVLPADVQSVLLASAGGNPLYAEEFARTLLDSGRLVRRGRTLRLSGRGDMPAPPTLQAMVAARLDTVDPAGKAVLAAAAVLGSVFWPAAVAALLDRDRPEVDGSIRELTSRRLIRPTAATLSADQDEYVFSHVLMRDVAYGSLPRGARARLHRRAAEWLTELWEPRAAENPEAIAAHYDQATALYAASGRPPDEELRGLAARYLLLAGERALGLDVAAASRHYRRALELLPADSDDRSAGWLGLGKAAWRLGDLAEARDAYAAAAEAARARNQPVPLGRALTLLAGGVSDLGDREQARALAAQAAQVLEPLGPTPALANAYGWLSFHLVLAGRVQEALPLAERAVSVASVTADSRARAEALHFRGVARCSAGDATAVEDFEHSLELALADEHAGVACATYLNVAEARWRAAGPLPALADLDSAAEYARRRGFESYARAGESERLVLLFELGRWRGLRPRVEALLAWCDRHGVAYQRLSRQPLHALVLAHAGLTRESLQVVDAMLPEALDAGDAELVVPALAVGAVVACWGHARVDALDRLQRLDDVAGPGTGWYLEPYLPDVLRACVRLGRRGIAGRLVDTISGGFLRTALNRATAAALTAESDGALDEAARGYDAVAVDWAAYGHALEHAQALLGAGRCRRRLDDPAADADLRGAAEVARRLGSQLLIREVGRMDPAGQAPARPRRSS